ncbi:MAG TPA: hypothetical protein VH814_04170, partial [Steroidobacteraceae bacterium]
PPETKRRAQRVPLTHELGRIDFTGLIASLHVAWRLSADVGRPNPQQLAARGIRSDLTPGPPLCNH